MSEHDVLFGFRLRLFSLAAELGNVSEACRLMGVNRSMYYRLKRRVDRWGLEALRVRERRRPRMPNEIGPHLEQRIIAFALGHPGYGPRRISAELAHAAGRQVARLPMPQAPLALSRGPITRRRVTAAPLRAGARSPGARPSSGGVA